MNQISLETETTNPAAVVSLLENIQLGANGTFLANCPAHPAELGGFVTVTETGDGKPSFFCSWGCQESDIWLSLGARGSSTAPEIVSKAKPTASPDIEQLRASLGKWLSIPAEDAEMVDFVLAVYKSHEIPGDPLWGMIIDASGAGKTELLRAFRKRPDAYFLSKLTEKSLVSGYRDADHPDKDPSLLLELDEKVLVIKDLSPLLSMRRESRNAILGDLRDAYDGFSDQARGNVGKVEYEARFSLIAASTLGIERYSAVDQELGERFIKFRARGDASYNKVRKAISNIGADERMRKEIEEAILDYLEAMPSIKSAVVPEDWEERLAKLADFTARARSWVARDRNGDLQYKPRPEVGTRLGKELGKLLLAVAAVRGKSKPDEQDFATVERVAEDCLQPNRLAVIKALRDSARQLRLTEIEAETAMPKATVNRVLDDLRVLGLVEAVENSGERKAWKLASR